jgi:hypothetical protein
MKSTITLMGDKITIDADRTDFYQTMLEAIADRVFQLLGPEFDKHAYLEEVEQGRSAVEIGQELAIPVSIMLSMELGYRGDDPPRLCALGSRCGRVGHCADQDEAATVGCPTNSLQKTGIFK